MWYVFNAKGKVVSWQLSETEAKKQALAHPKWFYCASADLTHDERNQVKQMEAKALAMWDKLEAK